MFDYALVIKGYKSTEVVDHLIVKGKFPENIELLTATDQSNDSIFASITLEKPNAFDKVVVKIHYQDDALCLEDDDAFCLDDLECVTTLVTSICKQAYYRYLYVKSKEELVVADSRFKSLLYNKTDIVTLLDQQGKVIYQSSSIKQRMKYNENDLQGKTIFEFIHPEDLPRVIADFREAMLKVGISKRIEFRLLDKDGGIIHLEAIGNNLLLDPMVRAFVIHSHDVSDRKNELIEKTRLLEELALHTNDLRRFAYITSHNLRSPITNLQSIILLLKTGEILDDFLLNGLEEAISLLDGSLTDLNRIFFIKDRSKRMVQEIQIKPSFDAVQGFLKEDLKLADAKLLISLDESVSVRFYEPYLQDILIQLIKNALYFRDEKRKCKIHLRLVDSLSEYSIEVEDNGQGFDVDKVEDRLFGFYQRFHTNSGKGLGPFLAQTQAQACGAHLSVQSQVGKGSIFRLVIRK